MLNKQKGFTLMELISVIVFLFVITIAVIGIYVVTHFINKFW